MTTAPRMKSVSERLAAARATAQAIAKQIACFQEARKTALLIDDDASAERADAELAALRAAAKRAADKIELLEQALALEREKAEQAWPDDLETARARLSEMEKRLAALNRRPRVDRSAVDQDEIDRLPGRISEMRARIELMERMAAA